MQKIKTALFILGISLLQACSGLPGNIKPVDDFDLERYLGTWYEIARLDHSFVRANIHKYERSGPQTMAYW